jgi:transposase
MAGRWKLADEQWEVVEPLLRPARHGDNRGRPWHDMPTVLNGVLRILGSGRSGPRCRISILRTGPATGAFSSGLAKASSLKHCACWPIISMSEADSIWTKLSWMQRSRAPQRGFAVGHTKRGKGTTIAAFTSGDSLPLAVSVESTSPPKCRLVEAVLAGCFLAELPERLIGDKAYDSDALDEQMSEYGIEITAPTASRRPRMGVRCVAIAAAGKSNDSLPECRTIVDGSHDGNTTSTTSSALCGSPASWCPSDIYEMASKQIN